MGNTLGSSGTRRRIGTALIVEDNDTISSTLEALLDDEGYVTRSSRTMSGARELLNPAPDVVVLDLTLADGFAEDLLIELLAAKLPTVIVSTSPLAHVIADKHGVELIRKPFELGHLLEALERARGLTMRSAVE
jgi:DNA-binding response OmpR family regulator